jgi:hypothetical protein
MKDNVERVRPTPGGRTMAEAHGIDLSSCASL